MPAIGNIVINDGAATPVAHTFSPDGFTGDVCEFHDRSGGISVGYPKITAKSVSPSRTSKMYKVTYKVVLPVLETASGTSSNGFAPAPTLAYNLECNMTFITPQRSTLQNRTDLLAFVKNLLADSSTTALVVNNGKFY